VRANAGAGANLNIGADDAEWADGDIIGKAR